jgi:hypothetical protein
MTKPEDTAPEIGKGKSRVEQDARGQFAKKTHGGNNNGVASASPRVTSGTDDSTTGTDNVKNNKGSRTDRR